MQSVCILDIYLCNVILKRNVMKELKCPKCGAIFTVDEARQQAGEDEFILDNK